MKITIYTITDCPFSKQEKEYLSSHGLAFEEKNLETNREFLTEMLAVGSNFAGTPVTKIEKDDGQIAVLKGFTAAEFDKTLGFTSTPAAAEPIPAPAQQTVPAAPLVQAPVEQPVVPVVPQSIPDPAMTSVLNTLEQQAQVAVPAAPVAQAPAPPVAPMPSAPVIPDPQF